MASICSMDGALTAMEYCRKAGDLLSKQQFGDVGAMLGEMDEGIKKFEAAAKTCRSVKGALNSLLAKRLAEMDGSAAAETLAQMHASCSSSVHIVEEMPDATVSSMLSHVNASLAAEIITLRYNSERATELFNSDAMLAKTASGILCDMPHDRAIDLFDSICTHKAAKIMEQMESKSAASMLSKSPGQTGPRCRSRVAASIVSELSASVAGRILSEMDPDSVAKVFEKLGEGHAADIAAELKGDFVAKSLEHMDLPTAAGIIAEMTFDGAAQVIDHIDECVAAGICTQMKAARVANFFSKVQAKRASGIIAMMEYDGAAKILEKMRRPTSDRSATDVASILAEMEFNDAAQILSRMDNQSSARAIETMKYAVAAKVLDKVGAERAASLAAEMQYAAAAKILDEMTVGASGQILAEAGCDIAGNIIAAMSSSKASELLKMNCINGITQRKRSRTAGA